MNVAQQQQPPPPTFPDRDIFADEICNTSPSNSNILNGASEADHSPQFANGQSASTQSPPCIVRSQEVPLGACTYGTTGYIATNDTAPPQTELEEKLLHFKAWSVKTFKCTRQKLRETLWNGQRTVDPDVEKRVCELRQLQALYREMLQHVRRVSHHLSRQLAHQWSLSELYGVMSRVEIHLGEEFNCNSQTQKVIYHNGATLLAALQFFSETLDTQVNKAMEDTLQTVTRYEAARVEYDAYANDVRSWEAKFSVLSSPQSASSSSDILAETKLQAARQKADSQRAVFERLREDVNVKLNLLEENRCRVMQKQMVLFHNSMTAFFTGNQSALLATVQQFSIRLKPPNECSPSWLETGTPEAEKCGKK